MDRLFDIMNIRSPHGAGAITKRHMFPILLNEYIMYLGSSEGMPLIWTQRNKGFIGFLFHIDEKKGLYNATDEFPASSL